MRELNKVILHCSATEEGKEYNAADIKRWHVEGNKWSDIGYHYVILLDGTIEQGRDLDIAGAHVKGENAKSIGVCYIGGLRAGKAVDTMTELQEVAWLDLVRSLRLLFGWMPVQGHNEFSNKACPSFNVQDKYGFLNREP